MIRPLAATLALALLSSCRADDPALAAARLPVFNGVDEYGEPATVLIHSHRSQCSGSVITPTVILTANHCVEGTEPWHWSVWTDWNGGDRVATSIVEIVRPGPFLEDSEDDVALLVADRAIPIAPYLAAWELDPDIVGQPVTIVGYGYDELGFIGFRQSATMVVVGMSELTIELNGRAFPGSGDSGGPVLDRDGRVIAVISRGGTGVGLVTRVDQHRWLLDPILRREGGCVPGDPEACDGHDDDCDLVVDEGCLAMGDPCTDASQCPSGYCEDVDGTRRCTLPCAVGEDGGCGPGAYCRERAACGEGWCRPGEPGEAPGGQPCDDDLDCASLACRDPGDGVPRCTTPCTLDQLECAAGEVCVGLECGGGCFPLDVAAGPRGLGEPCAGDGDCRSGRCEHETDRSYCTAACDPASAPCPEAMHCRSGGCVLGPRGDAGFLCVTDDDCEAGLFCWTERNGAPVCTERCSDRRTYCVSGTACDFELEVCVPDAPTLGEACDPARADACAQGQCVEAAGGWVCSVPCDEACPDGFVCTLGAGSERYCGVAAAPIGEGCACAAAGGERSGRAALVRVLQLAR